MSDIYLAFDIGGTRLKSGVIDAQGTVLVQHVSHTESHLGINHLIDRMITLGRQLIADIGFDTVTGVGVACTGVIDTETGTVLQLNGKFPDIEGTNIAAPLSHAFSCPCRVDNDARTYAIGEWLHGAGRGVDDLVCITIGTGIGSGVVQSGKILRSAGHLAGILAGHLTVEHPGLLCSCGNRGCLETRASVTALLNAVRDHIRRGHESVLKEVFSPNADHLTGEVVFDAWMQDDPLATAIMSDWISYLGAGIVTLIHAYDPNVVIVGGGIMSEDTPVLAPLRRYVQQHAWTLPKGRTQIVATQLGDNAALIGAAALLK